MSSYLQTNITNQNPNPAHPGEPVELTCIVQNAGSNNLKDITVSVRPHTGSTFYPFSQLDNQPLTQSISYLNAMQNRNDAASLKFDLAVDSSASVGTYYIDVVTTAKEDDNAGNVISTITTLAIDIKGKEYAQVVTVNTANIDIGKVEPLEFNITNTGSSALQNMVVSWTDPKSVIFPVYSDNTKYIKHLDANQTVTVNYYVMSDVSATPGLYNLNINLTFEDYNSQAQTIKTIAGLFVGGPTDFDVSYSESSQGQVSIAVANIGNNVADAVKVSIPTQTGYSIGGSPSTIIGNLEKGDYTIASFNVSSSSTNTSSPLKLEISYTDPQGNRLTEDKEVTVPSNSTLAGSTKSTRTTSNNNLIYAVVSVIVIIVGIYIYRKRKQNKSQVELVPPLKDTKKV
jgi:hypothetical protein